jgi:hypothetical protein
MESYIQKKVVLPMLMATIIDNISRTYTLDVKTRI